MNLENNYDATIVDLDQCLMENKIRHRSPIIHLPELFMYKYSYQDVVECANNFKSCVFDKADDPVVNTVNYYSHKYENIIPSASLNEILDIIYENAYSIFHIDKDGTTYMASLLDNNPTICIDSVCLNWNQMPDNQCDVRVLWKTKNQTWSFEDFAKTMFDKVHDKDYHMNKNLAKILGINQDVKDNFDTMPYFTYASEESNTLDDFDISALEAITFDFDDDDIAMEAPGDGLSDLENMTSDAPAKPTRGGRRRRQRSADPVGDLENMTNEDAPDNERAPTTNDNTAEGNEVDIAQMTNDQMEQNGDANTEELANDETNEDAIDAEGEEAPPEEGEEPTEGEDDLGMDETPEDDTSDENEDDEKLLNNPESKEGYRKRFIALYKHINDVIDTLERFTPAFDVKCTNDYYTIQNDMYRLKTAIYKICTEKIKDMQTVDVMNAYLTANYAYDSMGEMLKEFFKHYRTERGKADRNKSKYKD